MAACECVRLTIEKAQLLKRQDKPGDTIAEACDSGKVAQLETDHSFATPVLGLAPATLYFFSVNEKWLIWGVGLKCL